MVSLYLALGVCVSGFEAQPIIQNHGRSCESCPLSQTHLCFEMFSIVVIVRCCSGPPKAVLVHPCQAAVLRQPDMRSSKYCRCQEMRALCGSTGHLGLCLSSSVHLLYIDVVR